MLDELCTRPNLEDVARNWLIDVPDALNNGDDATYHRSVPCELSKSWHTQDGSLITDRH